MFQNNFYGCNTWERFIVYYLFLYEEMYFLWKILPQWKVRILSYFGCKLIKIDDNFNSLFCSSLPCANNSEIHKDDPGLLKALWVQVDALDTNVGQRNVIIKILSRCWQTNIFSGRDRKQSSKIHYCKHPPTHHFSRNVLLCIFGSRKKCILGTHFQSIWVKQLWTIIK